MKRILLLGGSRYLVPVIKEAHELGYYVITCDYLPENIAHKYSDEYHNVSIIDKEKVLQLARELYVDGVMSFATDPGVTTAAYVCEQLGLPTCPYSSVEILQNKDKFRRFLKENGFKVPASAGYESIDEAISDAGRFQWPVIVKPVDSAGSKGVTKVNSPDKLREAIYEALRFSISGRFIIEEFIEKLGDSSDTDCFSINGKMAFVSFSNQKFDEGAQNPYTPAGYSWPSKMSLENQKELANEFQRLISLLKLGTSIYNVETRVGRDGKPYIMEFTPRGGGNRLSEVLHYATGVNLIRNAVKAAVGETDLDIAQRPCIGYWGEVILHSNKSGVFISIDLADELKVFLFENNLWVKANESIEEFVGANTSIGTLIFRFDTQEQCEYYMNRIGEFVHVNVQ